MKEQKHKRLDQPDQHKLIPTNRLFLNLLVGLTYDIKRLDAETRLQQIRKSNYPQV